MQVDFSPLDRHDWGVLQFSGGKDSLACLTLLRPYLYKIVVAWANSGDAPPEQVDFMMRIRASVPRFIEVKGNAPQWIEEHGWPVDVLPVSHSATGRILHGGNNQLMQPFTDCCAQNVWGPMQRAMLEMKAPLVIRGQRNSEKMKSTIRSGHTQDGVEYWFPIEDWSEGEVFQYLRSAGVELPQSYLDGAGTSVDCLHCTAWMRDNSSVMGWLEARHPDAYREVCRRLSTIRSAALEDVDAITEALT